jgi:methylglyoxal synthase
MQLNKIRRRISLVAHDSRKQELKEWVEYNKEVLDCSYGKMKIIAKK